VPARRQRTDGIGGLRLPPKDLTLDQLAAAPVLKSVDDLVIDEMTDAEYDTFVAALEE
jgi:hypothetical protein